MEPLGGDYVIRINLHKWDQCPYKRDCKEPLCLFHSVRTLRKEGHFWTRKLVLTTQLICLDLGEMNFVVISYLVHGIVTASQT